MAQIDIEDSGPGLTIAKMLTGLMGGELGVTSTPCRDSTFSVKLFLPEVHGARDATVYSPAVRHQNRLFVRRPRRGYVGARRRNLVVDNEGADRDVLGKLLQPLGFERRSARAQPLARDLLLRYHGTAAPATPIPVLAWPRRHVACQEPQSGPPRLSIAQGATRLTFRLHQQIGDSEGGGDWLIIMQEVSEDSVIKAIAQSFKLTPKEAEVLYWVVKGKTNRDIGDIVGSSPMTVKKHLERVFAKLGVETRTAAAAIANVKARDGIVNVALETCCLQLALDTAIDCPSARAEGFGQVNGPRLALMASQVSDAFNTKTRATWKSPTPRSSATLCIPCVAISVQCAKRVSRCRSKTDVASKTERITQISGQLWPWCGVNQRQRPRHLRASRPPPNFLPPRCGAPFASQSANRPETITTHHDLARPT